MLIPTFSISDQPELPQSVAGGLQDGGVAVKRAKYPVRNRFLNGGEIGIGQVCQPGDHSKASQYCSHCRDEAMAPLPTSQDFLSPACGLRYSIDFPLSCFLRLPLLLPLLLFLRCAFPKSAYYHILPWDKHRPKQNLGWKAGDKLIMHNLTCHCQRRILS